MQTECLVVGRPETVVTVSVRFLQLVGRLVGQFPAPQEEWPEEGTVPWQIVESLRVGDESSTPGKKRSSKRSIWANRAWRTWLLKPSATSLSLEPQRRSRAACATGGDSSWEPSFASDERVEGAVELECRRSRSTGSFG